MDPFRLFEQLDRYIVSRIGIIRSRRIGRFMVGIIPALGCLFMVVHCATLLIGFDFHLAAFLFKYSLLWWFLMSILSIAFEFCWVHRSFCAYNYIIGFLIEHQRLYGFGIILTPLRWIFLAVGLFLIMAFFYNNCWKDFFGHTKHYQ